jgi:putative hydrolase
VDTPLGPFDPEAFADSPLFREMQRVLASSPGVVNWELARQVGIATAQEGHADPAPSDEDARSFEEAARVAELRVATFTGLEPPPEVAPVVAARRADWVADAVEGLRRLIEPAAARATAALADLGADAREEAAGLRFLEQLSPLLLGAQVGAALGPIGSRAFGRYDIAAPRSTPPRQLFVVANVAVFEKDWSLDPTELRTLVALHEVVHRFALERPWVREHVEAILRDFFSTLAIDVEGLRSVIERLEASSDPGALGEALASHGGLFGAVLDDEQRIKLGRIQAFFGAAEGYGDHVSERVARDMLPTFPMIDEAMRRHRETSDDEPALARLLGVEVDPGLVGRGRSFCDAVADLAGEAVLATMWASAEALPSLPELDEPRLWLARSA